MNAFGNNSKDYICFLFTREIDLFLFLRTKYDFFLIFKFFFYKLKTDFHLICSLGGAAPVLPFPEGDQPQLFSSPVVPPRVI